MDAHAALDELRSETERESGGVHSGVQPVQRASEEERRVAAGTNLGGRDRDDLIRCAERSRSLHDPFPGAHLRLRRRNPEHRRLAEPRVHVVRLAPGADPAHGVLRGAADGERRSVAGVLAQRRRVAPERLAEAAVPPARAVPAYRRLEYEDVGLGLEREQLPRRPEAEVPAPHDDDVRDGVSVERTGRRHLAGFLEPPTVPRVPHQDKPLIGSGSLDAVASGVADGIRTRDHRDHKPCLPPGFDRVPSHGLHAGG